jgi:hypothetical protein
LKKPDGRLERKNNARPRKYSDRLQRSNDDGRKKSKGVKCKKSRRKHVWPNSDDEFERKKRGNSFGFGKRRYAKQKCNEGRHSKHSLSRFSRIRKRV